MKITKIAFYVRDIPHIADFYARHFGFVRRGLEPFDRLRTSAAETVVDRYPRVGRGL